MEIVSENRVNFTAAEQADGAQVTVEGKVQEKRNPLIVTGEYLLRAMMGIRSVSLTLYIIPGTIPSGLSAGNKIPGMSDYNDIHCSGLAFYSWLQR